MVVGFTQQTTHLPTTDRTSKQTTHMPTTDRASKQTTHLPTTDRTGFSSYYSDDDDEFESVSQISGNLPVSELNFSYTLKCVTLKCVILYVNVKEMLCIVYYVIYAYNTMMKFDSIETI